MTRHDGDDELRSAFQALRDEERRRSPVFGALLSPPAPSRAFRARWVVTTAVAAASVAIVGLVLHGSRIPGGPSLEESIAMAEVVSSWTAASDEFVTLSGATIREGVPNLEMTSLTLPEWPADDVGASE